MPTVIVERTLEQPTEFPQLQAMEDASAWCLELHHVTFRYTFLSTDRKRMICVYDAPDAESVRMSQRTAGLPFDRVWTADTYPAGGGAGDENDR